MQLLGLLGALPPNSSQGIIYSCSCQLRGLKPAPAHSAHGGANGGWGLGKSTRHVCTDRQTDRQATVARDPTPLSHNTSLQAPGWARAPSPGSAQGIVEVILRLFPCSYLSHPLSNKQSDRKTNRPVARAVLTERQTAPSPTPRGFLTKVLHTEPLRLCSSHPQGITLLSILKAAPPPPPLFPPPFPSNALAGP